ncbi:MAG: sulfite exporter TauE/SafE family protein [Chromatiaceae bacterium]|nr:sulfite exporter TauE/SafE family protein [Chromatiaceae bacterium]
MEPSLGLFLLMGLFGSVHCVAMCGPIAGALALSLPTECRRNPLHLAGFLVALSLGRILSYGLAGGLGGLLGSAIAQNPLAPSMHDILRGLAALILILTGLYLTGWFPRLKQMDRLGAPVWRRLEPLQRRLLPMRSRRQAFLYGMVWGWLPCGLVYYALLLTLAAEDPLQGMLMMSLFGLGTLPAILGLGSFVGWIAALARRPAWRAAAGLLLSLIGLVGLLVGGDWF